MNLAESLKNGFSISYASRLMRGFPSNWQSLLTVRIKVHRLSFFAHRSRRRIPRSFCFGGTRRTISSRAKPSSRQKTILPPNPIPPPFLPAFAQFPRNPPYTPSPRESNPSQQSSESPRESSLPIPRFFLRSQTRRFPAGIETNCWPRLSKSPRELHGSFMNRFFPRGIRFGRCNPFPRGRRKLQIPRCSRHPRFVETWKPGKWRNGERWNPRGCKSREWTFTAGMEGEPRIGPIPRFWRQNFPRKCPSLPSKSWKPGKFGESGKPGN